MSLSLSSGPHKAVLPNWGGRGGGWQGMLGAEQGLLGGRGQAGEAVTSSVSSKMPLRDERKVLSTANPCSPAAGPASGGWSRRSQAPIPNIFPATAPTASSREREAGRQRPGLVARRTLAGKVETRKPGGQPAAAGVEAEIAEGGVSPDGPSTQLPRVPLWPHPTPQPARKRHMGRGGGGGGVVSPSPSREPSPGVRAARRGLEGRGGGLGPKKGRSWGRTRSPLPGPKPNKSVPLP